MFKKLFVFQFTVVLALSGLARSSKTTVPNCVPVKEGLLYAAVTELTNFQYAEFLYDLRMQDSKSYMAMYPDTGAWRLGGAFNEPYVEYYHRHPAYRDYPVVNITWEQANAYCDWLEKRLNQGVFASHKSVIARVDVRLPTELEWKLAARGGNPDATFPWYGTGMRHTEKPFQGLFMANCVRGRGDYMGVAGGLNDNADITAPAKSYWPNGYGLYNMAGNVAEMLAEPGRTRGGSWRCRAKYLQIEAEDPYQGYVKASPEIGFRYFVEVLETRDVKQVKSPRLNARTIEKLLVHAGSDSVLVSKVEVTNWLYTQFLKEQNNHHHRPQDSLWLGAVDYGRKWMNDYSTAASFSEHPVVNITRADAEAFCSWLEHKYNSFSRKKYKSLQISLPTEDQWEYIAAGGRQNAVYAWDGYGCMDNYGKWRCNFNPVEQRWVLDRDTVYLFDGITEEQIRSSAGQDGYTVTAEVKSYSPNLFGVYNMNGNVAEMVVENVTKGGSWGSLHPDLGVKKSQPYSGANPYTGFRFVAVISNN